MVKSLSSKLREFKLAGMVNSLEERLQYANDNSLSYREFLELLCEDELNNRRDNSYKKRYSRAKLPGHKTIEEFDFSFQPSIDKRLINDASTCNFISSKQNIIFIGSPGTGKTHLAISLAIKSLSKNYKVLFTTVSDMLYQLHISKADNSYYKKLNEYISPDLLVMDELGFKKLPDYSANDFFEVVSKRYERNSTIITTNKKLDQWGEIFADNILAGAIQDRLVHHALIFNLTGQSYRARKVTELSKNQA